MTRLDRHVQLVRTKLLLGTLLACEGWALMAFASLCVLWLLVDKFIHALPPIDLLAYLIGGGVAVVAGFVWAMTRRPTERQAAVAIDERLGLDEKFSTALYIRRSNDPFAAAALRDAERTAENVSLHKRFPVAWPRHALYVLPIALVAAILGLFVPQNPLFGQPPAQKAAEAAAQAAKQAEARQLMKDAIREIDAATPEVAQSAKVRAARAELAAQLAQSSKSAAEQQMIALKSKNDLEEQKQKIAGDERLKEDGKTTKAEPSNPNPFGDKSALKDVFEALDKNQFTKAADSIEKVTNNFNHMKKDDQKQAAADVSKMAKQLEQSANGQQEKQEDIKKQLQKMGANQQQLNQLQQAMQAAAQGDKQAQQQAQNLANQVAQQIANNAQNGTPQQKQQAAAAAQQLANKLQQAANTQAGAQNMANAAQQLAKAMKQQANGQQGQGQQPNGQQANAQQANAQQANAQQANAQQANAQQANAQQAQGQQANGQKGQGQNGQGQPSANGQQQAPQPGGQQAQGQQANGQQGQGQQPGQQAQGQQAQGQQAQGQQANGQQQPGGLADPLAQFQQAANDAQMGQQGGNGEAPGNLPNPQGQAQNGQPGQGDPNNQNGNGPGQWQPNPPQGFGGRGSKQAAIAGFKPEKDASQTNPNGELIAQQFIKAPNVKGKSTAELRQVIKSAQNDAPDTVDQDHISKQEEAIIKKYYDSISGK